MRRRWCALLIHTPTPVARHREADRAPPHAQVHKLLSTPAKPKLALWLRDAVKAAAAARSYDCTVSSEAMDTELMRMSSPWW